MYPLRPHRKAQRRKEHLLGMQKDPLRVHPCIETFVRDFEKFENLIKKNVIGGSVIDLKSIG